MNRKRIAVPTGLLAGALVGLMIGGLWLHWQLGTDMNVGHPFVLITDFLGLRRMGQDPWRSAYLIVLAGAVLLSLLTVAFTLIHQPADAPLCGGASRQVRRCYADPLLRSRTSKQDFVQQVDTRGRNRGHDDSPGSS